MQKLTRMKLVNWHRFQNETLEFADSVLLSGENGAGKSTILDAIQLVITCSKNHFNKAAHEKGKRTLNGYIRCKTGREDRPYERTGELSAHVALEFYDDARKMYFVVGAVMDSSSEEKEPNVVWYLMDRQELKEELFFRKAGMVKSISEFRSTNKNIRQYAGTMNEAKKIMLTRFGRLEEKFFSLIPKALAFKPIHDIKDFVYSYVLDEKDVNIDTLRENVRSYQDLERVLQDVKTRIAELEEIREKETAVERGIRRDEQYQYYLARAEMELTERKVTEVQEQGRKAVLQLESLRSAMQQKEEARRKLQETMEALQLELNSDGGYQAYHLLEQEEQTLVAQLKEDAREVKSLLQLAGDVRESLGRLLQVSDVDDSVKDYAGILELLPKWSEQDQYVLADVILCLEKVIQYKKKMYARIQEKLAEIRISIREQEQKLSELGHRIAGLRQRQLTFPAEVTELRMRIAEQFRRTGRTGEPRILCELLEVTNPAWQNAVEGYLNTQRFYLLVEPQDFDLALSVYDRMRENKKVYGVGLINTAKLAQYDEIPEGSLAQVVEAKNIWARRYINMVLGKVHMCQSYQELKKYPTAITRQCMRYQNHVVSAIRPEIYERPYIGAEAIERQLQQALAEQERQMRERDALRERMQKLEYLEAPLSTEEDVDLKFRLPVLEQQARHLAALSDCRDKIKKLKQDQTFMLKQIRLEELRKEWNAADEGVRKTEREVGECYGRIQSLQQKAAEMEMTGTEQRQHLDHLIGLLGEQVTEDAREYEKQLAGRTLEVFIENFDRTRKANWTLKEKAENEMREAMRAYKVAHDFGAADTLMGYPEFLAEYQKLKDSQLLEYEDKVYRARAAAEEEFREQFLSRLQENIKQAQTEFKELNRSLQDIAFSREHYEFLYEPAKKQQKYYQMIMDDFNVLEGESIFSGMFNANHKEVIEELFEKLALDDDNSSNVLELYTDYRTYMDYDIKITAEDGSYMLYSKVSQEKSGGETQTPFYITVAASFMQLYRNSIGGNSIGLVMLDEAFNNMDDERIGGVLEFMTNSNLQLLIAAPPDKIQYIGPSMKKVLLVLQDGKQSYVEDFTRK